MRRLPTLPARPCIAAFLLAALPAFATPPAGPTNQTASTTPAAAVPAPPNPSLSPAHPAIAGPTPTIQSVHEYMEVNGLRQKIAFGITEMKSVVFATADRLLPSCNLNPEQIEIAGRLRIKMAAIVESEMGWAKKESAYTEIYRATYTQRDIDTLIAFCTSPIGKVYLAKDPGISKSAKRALDRRTAELNEQLTAILNEGADEMQRARDAFDKK